LLQCKKGWGAFTKKRLCVDLCFNEVVDVIVRFVTEPINAIVKDLILNKVWQYEQLEYKYKK